MKSLKRRIALGSPARARLRIVVGMILLMIGPHADVASAQKQDDAPAHTVRTMIVDALGRSVSIVGRPRRIVTIFSSNTELVAALGLADSIVGIDALTRHPREILDKPKVGGRLGFSVDLIVAQKPDLIIMTPARQAYHQLARPMERIGIPVIVLLSRTVKEVISNLLLLGHATGEVARAELAATELESRLASVAARVALRSRPRALMITGTIGNGLVLVARAGTYTTDAMRLAGADPVLSLDTLAQISPEAVFAAAPDVLLFAGDRRSFDTLLMRPGWRDMAAVREGRAYIVSRSEFLIPGPRTIDGIERLAEQLHPKLPADAGELAR